MGELNNPKERSVGSVVKTCTQSNICYHRTTKESSLMLFNEKPITKKLLEPPQPCPNQDCTSSDGFHIWEKLYSGSRKVIDGHCFVCRLDSRDPYGDLKRSNANRTSVSEPDRPVTRSAATRDTFVGEYPKSNISVEEGLRHPIRGIPTRGISYSTAEYFGVRIGVSSTDGETPIYTLFPRHRGGNLIGWTVRTKDKGFYHSGGSEPDLFGAHLCKPTGKKLYITEGQYDAMSLFQALKEGSNIPDLNPSVVSLPLGAGGAVKSLILSSSLVDGYDELILCFDSDEAGKLARIEVCKAYAGKVSYVTIPHPHKDANDMLMAGKGNDLKWLGLTGTKRYHPDGIVRARDLKNTLDENEDIEYFSYPEDMQDTNYKVYGLKKGTITTVLAGTGVGKTAFLHKLFHHFIVSTLEKIAGLFLEEDKKETAKNIMGLEIGKRINLPGINATKEEQDEAFDKLFNSDRVSFYDYFGGMDDSTLLSKLRYFAITGHSIIFLDHLSFLISEFATEGDERKKIDVLMNKLAKFVKEYNVALVLVVHVKKAEGNAISFEEGAVPSLDSAKGSSAIKQASWDVCALARNQQHSNEYCRHTTELNWLKCRLTGRTGVAEYLHFDGVTGRMDVVEKPQGYREPKRRGL